MLDNDTCLSLLSTHHIFDLWQGDLQGDIEGFVCVIYRSQSVGVVLHQVIQKFAGIMTLSTVGHWGGEGRAEGGHNSKGYSGQTSGSCRDKSKKQGGAGFAKRKQTCVCASVTYKHQTEPTCRTDLAAKGWSKPSALPSSFSTSHKPWDQLFSKAVAETAWVQIKSVTLFWSPFSPAEAERAERPQKILEILHPVRSSECFASC